MPFTPCSMPAAARDARCGAPRNRPALAPLLQRPRLPAGCMDLRMCLALATEEGLHEVLLPGVASRSARGAAHAVAAAAHRACPHPSCLPPSFPPLTGAQAVRHCGPQRLLPDRHELQPPAPPAPARRQQRRGPRHRERARRVRREAAGTRDSADAGRPDLCCPHPALAPPLCLPLFPAPGRRRPGGAALLQDGCSAGGPVSARCAGRNYPVRPGCMGGRRLAWPARSMRPAPSALCRAPVASPASAQAASLGWMSN